MRHAVRLAAAPPSWLGEVVERAASAASAGPGGRPDLTVALDLASEVGTRLGGTVEHGLLERWEVLATLGAVDLAVARAVEPHLDAAAILHEAGCSELLGDGSWGVYAAEGPVRLEAREGPDGWRLTGEKSWCSLAGLVDHALVTAHLADPTGAGADRGLFAVRLDDAGVDHADGPEWVARGLPEVRSTGLVLHDVPAVPVGGPGWYLRRPGFWHGGIGVAAVWYGGAVAVARRLRRASERRTPDQVALVHLGRADTALVAAAAVLREVAVAALDEDVDGALLALRARQVVADAVDEVLALADRGMGPAPLALEEEHARRVADLRLYVRQHHAERDLARQGERVLAGARW